VLGLCLAYKYIIIRPRFKKLADGELTSPRVDQSATWLTASWLSAHWSASSKYRSGGICILVFSGSLVIDATRSRALPRSQPWFLIQWCHWKTDRNGCAG